jgi:putative transposase
VYLKINGVLYYLGHAVDQDGDEIDILVQKRKDKMTAMRFFKKLFKGQLRAPIKIVTDKLKSYLATKQDLIPSVNHPTSHYENNGCELSHQQTRLQERQMRWLKSQGHTQKSLACHGVVNNLFLFGGYLMKASNYRIILNGSFAEWNRMTCVQNLMLAVENSIS